MTHVFVLLGSNIDSERNMCRAVKQLTTYLEILDISPVYETEPVGKRDQPDFLNAAVLAETELALEHLKTEVLERIEARLGRRRSADKSAPRTIDLDIVLFGDAVFDYGGRHIPDPELYEYAHISKPLADIAPDYRHPETGERLCEIVSRLSLEGLRERPDVDLRECLNT